MGEGLFGTDYVVSWGAVPTTCVLQQIFTQAAGIWYQPTRLHLIYHHPSPELFQGSSTLLYSSILFYTLFNDVTVSRRPKMATLEAGLCLLLTSSRFDIT